LTEESLLEPKQSNTLASLGRAGGELALASAEMSTGQFRVSAIAPNELAMELARLNPSELIAPDSLLADPNMAVTLNALGGALTVMPGIKFESGMGERALKSFYGIAELDGFGSFSRAEISAAGALIGYLELTQKGKLPALLPLARDGVAAYMAIDAATRRNLELMQTLGSERRGSFLSVIDRSVTAAGARLLSSRLAAPLTDVTTILHRQEAVAHFVAQRETCEELREKLRGAPDIARALARLSVQRGGPRDLGCLRDGVTAARQVRELVKEARGEAGDAISAMLDDLVAVSNLADKLTHLLVPEPPFYGRDGGFIRQGAHAGLDEIRSLRDESRRVIAQLEAKYRDETGTPLKIKHNGVLGYFIEVTPQHADKLMTTGYRHRQTMGGAVRFSTDELSTLANRISQAGDQALALEKQLFDEMAADALAAALPLSRIADALAVLDVAASLADLARTKNYTRPKIDGSKAFSLKRARHPVVEAALLAAHTPFVPNDADLSSDRRLWLVTGPNMAGKSTFLRQNALIVILAQMGSFVPAESAHIGIVDRLFSRVGAGDDLAAGRSTFMVEMVETAAILNQATEKSLVILDEIGRGTATFDGLAIAWATAEHLCLKNKSRALFATHYHEMTALAERLPSMACVTMKVREWNDSIVFLHEVVSGVADRSYGIHVAKLAGLPPAVVERAGEVLKALEEGREGHKPLARIDDLPLFSATAPAKKETSAVEESLRAIDPDALTPKGALEVLYQLKGKLPV
jgi:DNA mismatch repair protein MutS